MVRPTRDDLYITVPSFFRCPISLDVMKSPVSLCTGVTYDRASIQRWLDNGNNTCPATMQVLHSKELVPNRTLQRLIEIWSESVHHHRHHLHHHHHHHYQQEDRNRAVPSREDITQIVKYLESSKQEGRCRPSNGALSKLVLFARESEENREFLANMDGLVPLLVDFLGNGVPNNNNSNHNNNNNNNNNNGACNAAIDVLEDVVRVLDMILTRIGDRHKLMTLLLKRKNSRNYNNTDPRDCLTSLLLLVLQQGNADSRIGSVRILESIAVDAESKMLIAGSDGLLGELVKSISLESDPSLIEASLSCLMAISMPKRVKIELIHHKTVAELRNLLTWSDATVSMTEKALKLLETLSSCKEGREEVCGDPACVEAMVKKALKVSGVATELAVTVLWSVCYLFGDRRAQEAVTRGNGLTKFLLLMQSNCSPAVRQMSADMLKIFRVNPKSCLSSYDTKTTHIMPF